MLKLIKEILRQMYKAAVSTLRESRNRNKVYGKYLILDAETHVPKCGTYFVLKLDAKDERERYAVNCALLDYANRQRSIGRYDYAREIEKYVVEAEGLKL